MRRPWNSILTVLSKITRENSDFLIFCTHCGNRHAYVKWGVYSRYLFNDELINIQRYRCNNDLCPCKTFSILPHAFLPVIRISLCMLMYVLKMYEQGDTIADIARHTGNNWQRIQRWISKALSIREWLRREFADLSPCLSANKQWSSFARNFSWAFYPARVR
jgi:transposase-like protein